MLKRSVPERVTFVIEQQNFVTVNFVYKVNYRQKNVSTIPRERGKVV